MPERRVGPLSRLTILRRAAYPTEVDDDVVVSMKPTRTLGTLLDFALIVGLLVP